MTTLTLNEIRSRAAAFAKEFSDASRENAESQIFWHAFFQVFGLPIRRVVSYEKNVPRYANDDERVAFSFKRYAALTSLV
jgi:hypothetical protein